MSRQDYLSLWGEPELYSAGTSVVMAARQIRQALRNGTLVANNTAGNQRCSYTHVPTGKWFLISGNYEDPQPTMLLGAICGDIAGSVYEFTNIKYKLDPEYLIHNCARYTDDSVMTCAVAVGLSAGLRELPENWIKDPESENILYMTVQEALLQYGNKYPYAGYGGSFMRWLHSVDPQPYNSWGNGSAMRVSYAGWAAHSLAEAEKLAEITAKVTHSHPDGIAGAQVVAGSIFILRNGGTKQDVKQYVSKYYDIDFSLDEIRDEYFFDVSCAGSVPQAVVAFLEGHDFPDVIANAISIGGDSDTIAAIAGSIAEVIYPIPQELRAEVIDRLDDFLINTIIDTVDFLYDSNVSGT